ncbi:hypothetical protein CWS02_08420 [Enterobacter sp. EA-1]|nr:hypothetical protein CWS02_08420 [Enterobacter sp. EA-1]
MSITRKRRSTGKVTLADVAQLAGVGTMTVSRAIRTPEQVSDKLREKIEAAVQELGYMPNLAASALASASSSDHRHGGAKPRGIRLLGNVRRATAGIAARRLPNHAGRVAAPAGAGRETAGNTAGLQPCGSDPA